mgnify:CR=1 FL=1
MENIGYFDFLSDTFTIEELDEAEKSSSTVTSQIVTKDEEPAPKRFKTATFSDVEKIRAQNTERTTDNSTKWAVGLLRGTYLLGFPLHIVVLLFCVKLLLSQTV